MNNAHLTPTNNIEIERKFLVSKDLPELINGKRIVQAYLFKDDRKELRIRISENKCTLSVKINMEGLLREEFEYIIPIEDGKRLIKIGTSYPIIEKVRYIIIHDNMEWELDFFEGENEGLIVAEIELESPSQILKLPSWVTEEVTNDIKYYNASLFENPYKIWKK